MCGVFHAPVLMLEMAPGDNDLSFLLMAIIEIPLYFVLIFLIDTVGRKPLYAWGLMAGEMISSFILHCSCSCSDLVLRFTSINSLLVIFAIIGESSELWLSKLSHYVFAS